MHSQILFGAMDVHYCVLLGMASWMEYAIGFGLFNSSDYMFCIDGLTNHQTIKKRAQIILREILNDPDFADVLTDNANLADDITSNNTGTHSIQKLVATFAKMCNCTPDEIDYRCRWKIIRRIQGK